MAQAFLLAAVVAILAIRGFLAATGYPQVGGSRLHIAHMLWGGLGMLAALLALLLFVGSRVRTAAAWIGGLGFGTFIDELGKFLTQDNDYFFRPAVALIYALFVVVFALVRFVARRRPSRAERLSYAYAALTDLALGQLSTSHRRRALSLLAVDDDVDDELVCAVRALLARTPAPARPPSRWTRLTRLSATVADRLYDVAARPRVRQAAIGLFFVLAGGILAAIVFAFVRRGDPTPPLNAVTIGSAAAILGVGCCSLLGVGQLLRGARGAALRLFYWAALVALLVGQFVAFIALQLLALPSLAVNLLVLAALQVELTVETRRE